MFGFLRRKKKPLRQQLMEARDSIERQLSIMAAGPANSSTRWQADSIAELEHTLHEINRQIADLGSGATEEPRKPDAN